MPLLQASPLHRIMPALLTLESRNENAVERSLRKRAGDAEAALAAAEQQVIIILILLIAMSLLQQVRSLTFAQELSAG